MIEAGMAAPPRVSAASQYDLNPQAAPAFDDQIFQARVTAFKPSDYLQKRWAVVAILFGVTGFLGLPLLWMNRRFSEPERWFWALLNILYTCGLIYGAYRVCLWSYRQVMGV